MLLKEIKLKNERKVVTFLNKVPEIVDDNIVKSLSLLQ